MHKNICALCWASQGPSTKCTAAVRWGAWQQISWVGRKEGELFSGLLWIRDRVGSLSRESGGRRQTFLVQKPQNVSPSTGRSINMLGTHAETEGFMEKLGPVTCSESIMRVTVHITRSHSLSSFLNTITIPGATFHFVMTLLLFKTRCKEVLFYHYIHIVI